LTLISLGLMQRVYVFRFVFGSTFRHSMLILHIATRR
jgi:hypothetical protein